MTVTRIGFEVINNDDNSSMIFDFNVNPTEMQETHGQRTVVLPTRTAVSVQDFGPAPTYYTLSGTTGWTDGYEKMLELKTFLIEYQNYNSDNIANDYTFIYHDYTDDSSAYVKLNSNGFSFSRNAQSPLMYNYSISFVAVGDATQASQAEKTTTVLGNSASSLTDGTSGATSSSSYINPSSSTQASSIGASQLGSTLGLK